jgi:hypothetical protein
VLRDAYRRPTFEFPGDKSLAYWVFVDAIFAPMSLESRLHISPALLRSLLQVFRLVPEFQI